MRWTFLPVLNNMLEYWLFTKVMLKISRLDFPRKMGMLRDTKNAWQIFRVPGLFKTTSSLSYVIPIQRPFVVPCFVWHPTNNSSLSWHGRSANMGAICTCILYCTITFNFFHSKSVSALTVYNAGAQKMEDVHVRRTLRTNPIFTCARSVYSVRAWSALPLSTWNITVLATVLNKSWQHRGSTRTSSELFVLRVCNTFRVGKTFTHIVQLKCNVPHCVWKSGTHWSRIKQVTLKWWSGKISLWRLHFWNGFDV